MTVTLDDSTIDSALLKGVDTRDLNQWLSASIKDQGYLLQDIAIQLVSDEQLLKAKNPNKIIIFSLESITIFVIYNYTKRLKGFILIINIIN